jgi:hypothetical protein
MTIVMQVIPAANADSGMKNPTTPFHAKGPSLKKSTVPAGMVRIAPPMAMTCTNNDQITVMNRIQPRSCMASVTSADPSMRKPVAIHTPIGVMNSRDSSAHETIWTSAAVNEGCGN